MCFGLAPSLKVDDDSNVCEFLVNGFQLIRTVDSDASRHEAIRPIWERGEFCCKNIPTNPSGFFTHTTTEYGR